MWNHYLHQELAISANHLFMVWRVNAAQFFLGSNKTSTSAIFFWNSLAETLHLVWWYWNQTVGYNAKGIWRIGSLGKMLSLKIMCTCHNMGGSVWAHWSEHQELLQTSKCNGFNTSFTTCRWKSFYANSSCTRLVHKMQNRLETFFSHNWGQPSCDRDTPMAALRQKEKGERMRGGAQYCPTPQRRTVSLCAQHNPTPSNVLRKPSWSLSFYLRIHLPPRPVALSFRFCRFFASTSLMMHSIRVLGEQFPGVVS